MGLMLQSYIVTWHIVTPSPKAAKSNHRGPIFTDSRPRNSCVPSVASKTARAMVRYKATIKRVQSHARMSSAERKQARCWKHQFSDFVLKIASIGDREFGSAHKMLYLCSVEKNNGQWIMRKRSRRLQRKQIFHSSLFTFTSTKRDVGHPM